MEDKNSTKIGMQQNIDELIEKYNTVWFPKFKDIITTVDNTDTDSAPQNELKPLLVSLQEILREAIDINYKFFCISLKEDIEKDEMERCNKFLGATQTNIQRIQNLHIFPIMLRLSVLTSREAKKRDYIILIISMLFSVLFSIMLFAVGVMKDSGSQEKYLEEIKKFDKDETSLIIDTLETNHIEKMKSDKELIYKIDSLIEKVDKTKNNSKENNTK